jgi:probable metal-binding protein
MNSVHGHDLLALLAERPDGFTAEDLGSAILERFGSGVRFHTCSRQDMTSEEVLMLFFSKGRIAEKADGRLVLMSTCGCGNHGHSHGEGHSHDPGHGHSHGQCH